MKKAGFTLIAFLLLTPVGAKRVFAENITTGNANAQSTVETQVSGNGTVTTHIETTVNGKTDIQDSNQSGSIEVTNNNGVVTVKRNLSPTISASPLITATPTSTMQPAKVEQKNVVESLVERISDFFKRVFKNL